MHWDISSWLVVGIKWKKRKMPLIMKHIVWLKLAEQWRYLNEKTGFLFSGTHGTMYASVIGTVRVRYRFTVRRSDFDPTPPPQKKKKKKKKKTIVYCATHTIAILTQPHCTQYFDLYDWPVDLINKDFKKTNVPTNNHSFEIHNSYHTMIQQSTIAKSKYDSLIKYKNTHKKMIQMKKQMLHCRFCDFCQCLFKKYRRWINDVNDTLHTCIRSILNFCVGFLFVSQVSSVRPI